jgi:hypothetical protein
MIRHKSGTRWPDGLASKPMVIVCQWFGLKTTVRVSWIGPQNQG